MDNDKIIKHLKEICSTSEPEEKKVFFQGLEDRGLTSRRPAVINHGDFLLRQFLYVGKWIWLLSAVLLLCITGICYGNTGNYPFALTPLLALGILVETGRSFRWKMAELVSGWYRRDGRTSGCYLGGATLVFVFSDQSISIYDGAVSGSLTVRLGI